MVDVEREWVDRVNDSSHTETEFALPNDYDLRGTLWMAGMGDRDPTLNYTQQEAKLAYRTPEGNVVVAAHRNGERLVVERAGEGGDWIEPRLSKLFGLQDRPGDFQPCGRLAALAKRNRGVHLPILPTVFHRLIQIVLQQLVAWNDALRAWRTIVHEYGEQLEANLWLPPSVSTLKQLAYYDLVECGVLPNQARLILRLTREASRIERLADADVKALEQHLLSIKGIGPWSVQHLLGSSCGDADAVMTGDYGLPNTVAWYLIDKARSDDEEMLQLLEPYRGHRFRVINLLMQSGIVAPRRGPRMRSNQWRFRFSN